MSGPKPKQQQSRSAKDGFADPDAGTLETITKEEAVEIAKSVTFDDLDFDFTGEEEDGEYS